MKRKTYTTHNLKSRIASSKHFGDAGYKVIHVAYMGKWRENNK